MKSDVADTLMRVAAFGHVLKLSETQNRVMLISGVWNE